MQQPFLPYQQDYHLKQQKQYHDVDGHARKVLSECAPDAFPPHHRHKECCLCRMVHTYLTLKLQQVQRRVRDGI